MLWRRLRHLTGRRRAADELAEEIETHRALRQTELERKGMSREQAAAESRRALGNVTLAREEARSVWTWTALDLILRDLTYALRSLRRESPIGVIAILTLCAGVSVTTTIFSVVESELWKPLPFTDPDRLISVERTEAGRPDASAPASVRDVLAWRGETRAFLDVAAFEWRERRVLRGRGLPESITVMPVTVNFFDVLDRRPAIGRSFEPSSRHAVVLSDSCWRRLFDADPLVVGTVVTLNDETYEIAGVASPDPLEFVGDPDMFATLSLDARDSGGDRGLLNAVARLQPGISVETAGVAARTAVDRGSGSMDDRPRQGVRVGTLREAYTGWNRRPLFFFLAAAVFVLVLSCANVASLLLARSLTRQREFAIRGALGGGRAALIRLLLVEGGVIAAIGGVGGLLVTTWTLRGLSSWLPPDYLNRTDRIVLDARSFGFALAATAATALIFALTPALFAARTDVQPLLALGGRTVGASRRQRLARHALVIFEITAALVLVFGAGLFLNSFVRLTHLPLGFDPSGRLAIRVTTSFEDPHRVVEFAARLLDAAHAVPGVADAAVATSLPLGGGSGVLFAIGGQPLPAPGQEPSAIVRAVTPGFHHTLAIRRLTGRDFSTHDDESAPRVAIISERLARRFFAGRDPLGQQLILLKSAATWVRTGPVQIVGVVADIKEVGLNEVDFNDISLPLAQHPPTSLELVANTTLPPAAMLDALRRTVAAIDPRVPVVGVRTLPDAVDDARRGDRFNLLLIGGFAVVAILMAGVGIYGVLSYAVAQRTREIGVRLALGAGPRRILVLALGEAVGLGTTGTILGLTAVIVIARLLGSALYLVPAKHNGLLYGITTTDPFTLAAACALVILISAAAGFVPARRATRIDPIQALRCD
jgi:putative ABC transport system permease protein